MKKSLVVALFVGIILPNLCSANIAGPFSTTTPISPTLTDWNGTLAFAKFNPSLGVLTKVQIDLAGSMSTVLTVTNSSQSGSQGNARTEMQISVQDSGGYLSVPQLDLISSSFTYNLSGGQSLTSGTLSKSGSSSEQYTAPAILTEFTGSGNILLSASTFTQTLLANTGGNTSASQVTNSQLSGSVTYYYNPVPEPATISLLSICGAVFMRRSK
jgi:hypothetical protein